MLASFPVCMLESKSLIKLRELGLNTYESKIWTALLSRGVSTAGELSDIANVPRSRSYDVLESLEKKGFVIMKLGKPIKYIAVPPREVLEGVKKNVQEKTRKEVTTIDLLKKGKMIEELMLLHERGIVSQDTLDISGSLTGRKNLYNHLEIMLKNAKKTVIMATNSERFSEKKDIFSGVFDVLAKKGVKIRVALKSDKNFKRPSDLNKIVETRATDVNTRFCVIDGKETLFMLFSNDEIHPSYDLGIWVVNPNLAKDLEDVFGNAWKSMAILN